MALYRSDVLPLDYNAPFAPSAKTYHGLTIQVGSRVVGRVRTWRPTAYTREGGHVYELDAQSFGRPVDYVPGVSTGFEIAFARVELWGDEIEIALGLTSGIGDVFRDLSDQTRPFQIDEYLFKGPALYRHWMYEGCWFKDRNESEATANGDGIYEVSATVAYIKRTKVL